MIRKIKRFVLSALIITLTAAALSPVPAAASQTTAQLPKAYWSLMDAYVKAVESKNHTEIAKTGDAILDLFLGTNDPAVKAREWLAEKAIEINIINGTSLNVLAAYEALNDVPAILRTLKIARPFVEAYQGLTGNPDLFVLNYLDNKLAFYTVPVDVFVEMEGAAGTVSYHSAKHEPRNGVLYGESGNNRGVQSPAYERSSAALVYVEFETETIGQFDYIIKPLADSGRVLEIAWNLHEEGTSLPLVMSSREKIESAAKYLASLNTPVLLRFAAEMNVWERKTNPQQFIDAFRFVADIIHKNAPNAAMVWSPNVVGHIDTTYDMFYPGDAYVDWVGISLYTSKYFMGDMNQSDSTQSIYKTGKYANPVAQIAPLINLYGERKPIMMSEGGVENFSFKNNTDESAFALERMRLMYAMMPVIYPQIKAMFWFNTVVGSPASRFSLNDSPSASALYSTLTQNPYFIQLGQTAASVSYKKLGDATVKADNITLLTYAPYLMYDNVVVTYRLDGKWMGAQNIVPNRYKLDISAEADGAHVLEVVVSAGDRILQTVKFNITKTGGSVTIYK